MHAYRGFACLADRRGLPGRVLPHSQGPAQRRECAADNVVEVPSDIRKMAFLGNYLPRQCGIATFTSDLLCAVGAEHPESL